MDRPRLIKLLIFVCYGGLLLSVVICGTFDESMLALAISLLPFTVTSVVCAALYFRLDDKSGRESYLFNHPSVFHPYILCSTMLISNVVAFIIHFAL